MPPPNKKKPTTTRATDHVTDQETVFCHLRMSGNDGEGMTADEAGAKMGLSRNQSIVLSQRVPVKKYMEEYRLRFMTEVARMEAASVAKFNVNRAGLISRLWSIANTPAERTRGSLKDQVEALGKISEVLGYNISPRDMDAMLEGRTDAELLYIAEHGKLPE